MLKSAILIAFVMLAGTACNNTSMAGSNGKRHAAEQTQNTESTPKDKKQDDTTDETDQPQPVDTDLGGNTDAGTTVPPTTQPDEVVDGQEVVNDCGRCVERAKILSAQANFIADILKTYNLGFYKIDPSRNLCDIHFMANMSDQIADHEGQSSVLGNQVVMYCPCNCNWASTEPPFDGPVPFTP